MSQGNESSASQSKQPATFSSVDNEDWSDVMDNFESEFTEDFENEDQTSDPEKLHKIIDDTLKNCSIDDLEKKIFSIHLAETNEKFSKLLEEIKKLSSKRKKEDEIRTKLKNCEDILECWQKCLNHFKKLKNVSITKVKSFPHPLFEIIKSSLLFCEMNEMDNVDLKNNFNGEVTALFKKTNEILNDFLVILESVIKFNVEEDSELDILSAIINEIGDTAVLVNRLDLKTLTGIWKQFGILARVHGEQIKLKFPKRVVLHFNSLSENVIAPIFSALTNNQQKVNETKIRCGQMFLKLLNGLWNIYCSSVSDENVLSAIKLLVQMYKYSPSCLTATKVDSSIIKLIENYISQDLDNFFNTVFKNEQFLKAFFEFGKGDYVEAVGFHLLTLNIMRKVLKLPYDVKRKWIIGEPSIIDVAFTNIDLLQLEICLGKVQIVVSRNLGDAPKPVPIYEETFTMIWGLICQVTFSDFGKVENLLVKHLMSGNFFSSLLTVDIFLIISRCTSTQLCYDHMKYFMKVYERLSERENSLEAFFLSFLIKRLYQTITERKKDAFIESIDKSGPDFWNPLCGSLTEKGKSILQNRSFEAGNTIPMNFQSLSEKPSVKTLMGFISLLKMSEICSREQDKQTMKILSNIWNSISEVIEFCEGISLILISELMVSLFHCHFPCRESFEDGTIDSILKSMKSLLPYAPPYVRVKLLKWMKNIFIHINDTHLSTPISDLYIRLLEDETPWVRQEAFEYLNDFTKNCHNEDLVGSVLQIIIDKDSLSESLPAYISSTPYHKLSGFADTEAFVRQLLGSPRTNSRQHTCYEISEREDKFPKLEESAPKSDFNVNQKIENICNQLDELLDSKSEISQDSLERLRQTFVKICDQNANS